MPRFKRIVIAPEVRELRDIPNRAQYRLILLRKGTGTHVQATVEKDPKTGCYYLESDNGHRIGLALFSGWQETVQSATRPPV